MKRSIVLFALAAVVAMSETHAEDSGYVFGIDVAVNHAGASAVSGYAQTPDGGKPGTSSGKRPTLDEIGVGGINFYSLTLAARNRQNEFYLGGNFIRASGSDILDAPLTTHGSTFPAGTDFHAAVNDDWYRAGFARWLDLMEGKLKIAPHVEAALFRYDYKFDANGISDGRTYTKPFPRVGLDGDFSLAKKTDILGSVAASIPIGSSPQIFTSGLKIRQIVFGAPDSASGAIFLGVGAMTIDYKDSQTMPNHVRFEAMPEFTIGFSTRM